MSSHTHFSTGVRQEIEDLYHQLLDAWNRRDAIAFGALFAEDGNAIGFDGSQLNGRTEITQTLEQIFAQHMTPPYISIVREVRFLSPDTAVLRAVVGMTPGGRTEINPALNAIQSLIATKGEKGWSIAVFQNTPAAFHGREELGRKLTEELALALNDKLVTGRKPA